jgi:ribosome recycling factor
MVARTKELAEEAKVAIRNIRRDANKQAEQEKKDKQLTEDESEQSQEEVQKLTKKFEDRSNDLAKAKEAEVMEE